MANPQTAGAASGALQGAAAGSAFGPWGTAIGAVVGGVSGYFGSKGAKAPQSATYTPVNVAEEQARAIGANTSNFQAASNLSARTNAFNLGQQISLMERAMPGFGALQKKFLAQADADLGNANRLPPEVQQQLQRFAAEKGVTRGTSGAFNSFNLVKDFGFNLIDWQNASRARALNTLSTVFKMAPSVNVMSPMSQMVDPNTAISVAGQNNQMQFNAQQAAFNSQAAASNYNTMMANGLLHSAISTAGSSADTIQKNISRGKSTGGI